MTQKELLHVEDIFNHEKLIIKVIEEETKKLKSRDYDDILSNQVKAHNNQLKKLEKLLCGEANG